jgi:hypothetical protein
MLLSMRTAAWNGGLVKFPACSLCVGSSKAVSDRGGLSSAFTMRYDV